MITKKFSYQACTELCRSIVLTASVLFFVFALQSCKEDTLLGADVIPGSDFINGIYTDTLTLNTSTVREDSLRTKNMSRYVLGAMHDDVFGNTYAGIYTTFWLKTTGIDFNDTAYVDSAVLTLTFAGHYGDDAASHNIRVYQLIENMPDSSDIDIYSDEDFEFNPIELGSRLNFVPDYVVDTSSSNEKLSIKLDTAFFGELLRQNADGAFANQAAFNEYFNGLFIAPDTTTFSDGMMYVDLHTTATASGLTIYYHTPATTGKQLFFPTNGSAVNSNYYKHNYVGTPVENALVGNDSQLFVQSMAGVKAKIDVPYLQNLGNILINKAEIEVTQLSTYSDPDSALFPPPTTMIAVANADGFNQLIPDQLFDSPKPSYGGNKQIIDGQVKYKFSVTAELQQMLNGISEHDGFYLLTFPSTQIADRIIVGGANRNDAYRLKLNLVYTRIP